MALIMNNYSPYFPQFLTAQEPPPQSLPEQEPDTTVTPVTGERARRRRTWDLQLSNELFERTKAYCSQFGKLIDTLSVEDFSEIGGDLGRSAEQCFIRIREIVSSGSTSAGAWCKAENELLVNAIGDLSLIHI